MLSRILVCQVPQQGGESAAESTFGVGNIRVSYVSNGRKEHLHLFNWREQAHTSCCFTFRALSSRRGASVSLKVRRGPRVVASDFNRRRRPLMRYQVPQSTHRIAAARPVCTAARTAGTGGCAVR